MGSFRIAVQSCAGIHFPKSGSIVKTSRPDVTGMMFRFGEVGGESPSNGSYYSARIMEIYAGEMGR